MPDFYDIDGANARIPELRETLLTLRSLRAELVELRDQIIVLNAPTVRAQAEQEARSMGLEIGPLDPDEAEEQTKRLRMRMQAIVDQMQAAVAQIDGWGIVLRDIATGLVDFPALVAGRQVWLCWRLGEGNVEWWHELTTGFDGRRRLEDLV